MFYKHSIFFVLVLGLFLCCYFIICFNYGTTSKDDIISKSMNYVKNGNNKLEHNDALIRAAVADQVKTLCAAEVQKKILSQNKEVTRYRNNPAVENIVVNMVRQEVRKAVEEMLYTYSQDKLNKADFALSSGGAKIISPLTSPTYEQWPTQWYKIIMASVTGYGITRGKPPITAIQPDTHVGQCWPFSGQQGQLAVLLSRQVYVTAVTYDHVSKTVAMGTTSAPKEFEIWGFTDDEELDIEFAKSGNAENNQPMYDDAVINKKPSHTTNDPDTNILDSNYIQLAGLDLKLGSSSSHLFLGQFVYDIEGSPIQTFEVKTQTKPIRAIIMKVNSNWDNPEYTCLYRFRVHGVHLAPTFDKKD